MGLNTRKSLHPKWTSHHGSVEDGFALAYIEIIKPNAASKVYDPVANAWSEDTATIFKGWARIQPNRPFTTSEGAMDIVPASSKEVAMFFNLKKNEATGYVNVAVDIRPGYEVIVSNAPVDPNMENFKYVVKSVINSSNTWSRGITCEINQEANPNHG